FCEQMRSFSDRGAATWRERAQGAFRTHSLTGSREMTGPADRRRFVSRAVVAALLATPLASLAQNVTTRVHRIGFLGNSTAALEANLVGPFREGLRDLGYVEGRNL